MDTNLNIIYLDKGSVGGTIVFEGDVETVKELLRKRWPGIRIRKPDVTSAGYHRMYFCHKKGLYPPTANISRLVSELNKIMND